MADYSSETSFSFSLNSEEDSRAAVELINEIDDALVACDDPENELPEKFAAFKDVIDFGSLGCRFEQNGKDVWCRDDCGTPNIGGLVLTLQLILKQFLPDGVIAFEWGNGCNRHLEDAFSGGAAYVTAEDIKVSSTYDLIRTWSEEKTHECVNAASKTGLEALYAQLGEKVLQLLEGHAEWNADTLSAISDKAHMLGLAEDGEDGLFTRVQPKQVTA